MLDNKDTTEKLYAVYESDKCIVRVYRPVLTQEEYDRRMAQIKRAAVDLLIAVYKQKEKKERANMSR